MILENKKILIMGLRNKWSIAWGAAIAASRQGAQIIFAYHPMENPQKLEKLIEEIPNTSLYPCDASEDIQIEELFSNIEKEHGKIDGILHSIAHANTQDLKDDFIYTPKSGFSHANDVSAYSFVAVCRYGREILNLGACIISLTYYGSQKVIKNYNIMGVAKAALECSVRYLANDLGSNNIRVNSVSAGPIKTLSAKGIKNFGNILEIVEEKSPLKRNVTAYEVGNVITFLLSDMASSITGQVIYADNGVSIMGF